MRERLEVLLSVTLADFRYARVWRILYSRRTATTEEARKWLRWEDDESDETIADAILEFMTGYRCDRVYVPMPIRRWAYANQSGLFEVLNPKKYGL